MGAGPMERWIMDEACRPIEIDQGRCSLCGRCVVVCERHVLVLRDEDMVIEQPQACDGCGACQEVCPEDAIDCAFEIVWDQDIEH